MIRLSPKDASVLARIAQYVKLPHTERKQMLEETTNKEARAVGSILLGELDPKSPGVSEDIKDLAKELVTWASKSKQTAGTRRQHRKSRKFAKI
jgi:hypothetical protein